MLVILGGDGEEKRGGRKNPFVREIQILHRTVLYVCIFTRSGTEDSYQSFYPRLAYWCCAVGHNDQATKLTPSHVQSLRIAHIILTQLAPFFNKPNDQ
jgi:hypothetical protein